MKVRKRITGGLLAMLLIISASLTLTPPGTGTVQAAKAVTETGNGKVNFLQQFTVVNANSESLISGIATPSLTYEYEMQPVLQDFNGGSLDPSSYALLQDKFPAGAGNDSYQTLQVSGIGRDAVSDENGMVEYSISVEDMFATAPVFVEKDKVYRYKLSITHVYLEKEGGTASDIDLLAQDMGLFDVPSGELSIICDLYVDGTGEIAGGVFYDTSGQKVQGFSTATTSNPINTAFIPTAVGSGDIGVLAYKVYNAPFSMDYIGENMTSNDFTYNIKFDNLPWWLTGTQLLNQSKPLIKGNSSEWTANDVTTAGNSTTISGNFEPKGGSITFVGIPVIGFDMNGAPTMSASFKFTSINGATSMANASQLDKYATRIYGGTKAGRANSISSLVEFNQSTLKALYAAVTWKAPTQFPLSTNSTDAETYEINDVSLGTITASSDEDINSIRFVMFDPSDAIIVGVAADFLPGILMILLAVGGAITFGISRREKHAF